MGRRDRVLIVQEEAGLAVGGVRPANAAACSPTHASPGLTVLGQIRTRRLWMWMKRSAKASTRPFHVQTFRDTKSQAHRLLACMAMNGMPPTIHTWSANRGVDPHCCRSTFSD